MKPLFIYSLCLISLNLAASEKPTYAIVDTAQTTAFDTRKSIPLRAPGESYYGQDANYIGNPPSLPEQR